MEIGIIAQATPDPKAFSEFWVIIAFLAGVAVNIVTLIVAVSGRKQKREVNFAFEPASKVEFEKFVDNNRHEHEAIFSKIGGVERGVSARCDLRHESIDAKTRVELAGIHNRINEVLAAVSKLAGQVEHTNQTRR